MKLKFENVKKNVKQSKFPFFQAGDLFSLDDLQIIQDLRLVLTNIREIISAPEFGHNHNDQSLVEICITRITSGKIRNYICILVLRLKFTDILGLILASRTPSFDTFIFNKQHIGK